LLNSGDSPQAELRIGSGCLATKSPSIKHRVANRIQRVGVALAIIVIGFSIPNGGARAQDRTSAQTRPNVFFDCAGRSCDSSYYRTEIGWVNWVRDRRDADLHLIMTSIGTGAGGTEYRFDFTGLEGRSDYVDQLFYQSLPTDTERESLDGIATTLAVGLARFATVAGYRGLVSVRAADGTTAVDQRVVSADEVDDPWNLWVFRINGSGNLNGETTRETIRLNSSVSASRVSPRWKTNLRAGMSFSRVEFDLDDGVFVDERTDWFFNQLIVKAIAEHWSVGVETQGGRFTRFNQSFRVEVTPALEYSVFPYEEATRRSFTFLYRIGPAYRDYIEETIFGETAETRFEQSLQMEFASRQTWGDASVSITGSHFLHDFDRNRLSLRGDVNFRVVRGFDVSLRGDIAWVDDQVYLSAQNVTDEETLLRLQQRATSFNYGLAVGFSVQFGSIFNNVVNNRFRGIGRGG
jgi:hypothetical protein